MPVVGSLVCYLYFNFLEGSWFLVVVGLSEKGEDGSELMLKCESSIPAVVFQAHQICF